MSGSPRHDARCVALQALYELDCTGHTLADVMAQRLADRPLPDEVRPFAYQLVNGVLAHHEQLDGLLQEYAPEWPIDQIAIVDRNILRMAILEIAVANSAPLRVAINEAVELAKTFGADASPRFINGVLGSLAANMGAIKAVFATQEIAEDPSSSS
ncbi:MAG: transcription antitermination factor NusB [Anaerolineae bacterium]|nr:transcription antitermination factor NusB [Anaerolineae bacterium]